ncbi:nucleoside/nucleotide kinase family protein [Lacisediminihabitans profunda]|uniref:nucleoside/nucleotide kinase family protein n=1 Tax=Lacisediminihabitans profunda TaxID=2594790 RepID=UPI001FE77A5D|nr:nucleoside/nucleotide kinase family protein [Lacisediminihabitans profunda]
MSVLRSIDEIAAVVTGARGDSRLVVGIVGPPGSGKSTTADRLVERLGDEAVLLPMDGYHLPQARLVELGRRDRMGAADTFDVDALVATLTALRFSGGLVLAPGFDREIEEAIPDAIAIAPEKRVLVVEGNYLLHDAQGWERVAPLIDLSFFVAVDHDIRLRRLIERHVRFGKTPDAAAAWATGPDEANARLIDGTAVRADHEIRLG